MPAVHSAHVHLRITADEHAPVTVAAHDFHNGGRVLTGDLSGESGQLLSDALRIASPDEPDEQGIFHPGQLRAQGLDTIARLTGRAGSQAPASTRS